MNDEEFHLIDFEVGQEFLPLATKTRTTAASSNSGTSTRGICRTENAVTPTPPPQRSSLGASCPGDVGQGSNIKKRGRLSLKRTRSQQAPDDASHRVVRRDEPPPPPERVPLVDIKEASFVIEMDHLDRDDHSGCIEIGECGDLLDVKCHKAVSSSPSRLAPLATTHDRPDEGQREGREEVGTNEDKVDDYNTRGRAQGETFRSFVFRRISKPQAASAAVLPSAARTRAEPTSAATTSTAPATTQNLQSPPAGSKTSNVLPNRSYADVARVPRRVPVQPVQWTPPTTSTIATRGHQPLQHQHHHDKNKTSTRKRYSPPPLLSQLLPPLLPDLTTRKSNPVCSSASVSSSSASYSSDTQLVDKINTNTSVGPRGRMMDMYKVAKKDQCSKKRLREKQHVVTWQPTQPPPEKQQQLHLHYLHHHRLPHKARITKKHSLCVPNEGGGALVVVAAAAEKIKTYASEMECDFDSELEDEDDFVPEEAAALATARASTSAAALTSEATSSGETPQQGERGNNSQQPFISCEEKEKPQQHHRQKQKQQLKQATRQHQLELQNVKYWPLEQEPLAVQSNNQQCKRWCFTLTIPTVQEEENIKKLIDVPDLVLLLVTEKLSPVIQTRDFQGLIVLHVPRPRLQAMKQLVGHRAQLEVARKSDLAIIKDLLKDAGRVVVDRGVPLDFHIDSIKQGDSTALMGLVAHLAHQRACGVETADILTSHDLVKSTYFRFEKLIEYAGERCRGGLLTRGAAMAFDREHADTGGIVWRVWQKQLLVRLEEEPSREQILWVSDAPHARQVGKSFIIDYLVVRCGALIIGTRTRAGDVYDAILNGLHDKIIFEVSHTDDADNIDLTLLRNIKRGRLYCTKEPMMVTMIPPWVLVFSEQEPDRTRFSSSELEHLVVGNDESDLAPAGRYEPTYKMLLSNREIGVGERWTRQNTCKYALSMMEARKQSNRRPTSESGRASQRRTSSRPGRTSHTKKKRSSNHSTIGCSISSPSSSKSQ